MAASRGGNANPKPDKAPARSARQSVTAQNRGDLTGRQKQDLAVQHQKELAERADEIAMEQATTQAVDNATIVNYTDKPVTDDEHAVAGTKIEAAPEEVVDPEEVVLDDGEVAPIEPQPTEEVVRAREDCRFIFGAANEYSFLAGRAYKVPFEVAQHMREKGLVWD